MTIQDQPPPTRNIHPSVWGLVRYDMEERERVGVERYGTVLQGFNGRDALTDAYQEALDMAVYLRQLIFERDLTEQSRNLTVSCECGGGCCNP
jgi:hypothetical protein